MSHKSNSNYHEGATQQLRDSPSESAHVSIHSTVLFFLLINILLASLLSVFVDKAEGPGPLSLTTGLVPGIWCFHRRDIASLSGWEPKTCSKPLQAEATQD